MEISYMKVTTKVTCVFFIITSGSRFITNTKGSHSMWKQGNLIFELRF